MAAELKSGSDGFRGIVGHSFTAENFARVILATANYAKLYQPEAVENPIPVGYDTRFLSSEMASFAAQILKGEGLHPQLTKSACPSPYIAFAARHFESPIGIQVTASHNPAHYNGIKLKGSHGGSLLPEAVMQVEELVETADDKRLAKYHFDPRFVYEKTFDLGAKYREAVLQAAGIEDPQEIQIVLDCMHGTASGIYASLLDEYFKVEAKLRMNPDALFGGSKPEPIGQYLKKLQEQVILEGNDCIGIAFDGDGDRLAMVDEQGRVLETHEIFCILLEHCIELNGGPAAVVRSVSFCSLVDRVARHHACELVEVPVGYKNISRAMLEHDALIGGEESGGTGFGHYMPERDALLMALIMLAAVRDAEITLAEMVDSLYDRFGRSYFVHRDVRLANDYDPDALAKKMRELAGLDELCGCEIESMNQKDGTKLVTNEGWVLVRPSGTEPLLRVYADAKDKELAESFVNELLLQLDVSDSD